MNKVGSAWVKRISLVVFLFRRTLGRCTAHILVSLPLVVVEVGARYRRRSDARVLFAAEEVEALHRLFEEAVEEADGVGLRVSVGLQHEDGARRGASAARVLIDCQCDVR